MKIRVILAALLLVGCESPLAPPLTGEQFILESIGGNSLPAPYAQNPEYDRRLLADTIAFTTDVAGEHRRVVEGYEDPSTPAVERYSFTYVRDGSRIQITYECPGLALCIQGPHLIGTVDATGMVITESNVSRHPLVFRRRFPAE